MFKNKPKSVINSVNKPNNTVNLHTNTVNAANQTTIPAVDSKNLVNKFQPRQKRAFALDIDDQGMFRVIEGDIINPSSVGEPVYLAAAIVDINARIARLIRHLKQED